MIIPYHIFLYKWNLYKKIWYQVIPTSFLDSSAGFMLLSAMWFCFCDDDDDVVIYCVLHVGDCSLFILAQKIKMKNMECPVSLPNQIMTFCKKVFNLGKSFFQVFLNTILFYVNNTLILFFFLSGGKEHTLYDYSLYNDSTYQNKRWFFYEFPIFMLWCCNVYFTLFLG